MSRPTFIELPASNLDATRTFYTAAFGWDLTGFGPSYASTTTGEVDVGLQGDAMEVTSAPLPVIKVDNLEAALRAVTAAGGVIARFPFSFPGGRRFHFLDPSGNELAVYEPV